jgi:hypothetical protein
MSVDQQPARRRRRFFVIGLAVGLFSGVVGAVVPVYGFPLLLFAAIAGLTFKPRAPGLAGILIGAGSVFGYGVYNTWAACRQTDNFCGGANIQPLLTLAVAMVVLGFATGVASLVRSGS